MDKDTKATGTPCCFVGNIGHDGPCKNISFQKDAISKNGTVATEDLPTWLRRQAIVYSNPEPAKKLNDAADEIERLRADKEHLQRCDGRIWETPIFSRKNCEDRAHG